MCRKDGGGSDGGGEEKKKKGGEKDQTLFYRRRLRHLQRSWREGFSNAMRVMTSDQVDINTADCIGVKHCWTVHYPRYAIVCEKAEQHWMDGCMIWTQDDLFFFFLHRVTNQLAPHSKITFPLFVVWSVLIQ